MNGIICYLWVLVFLFWVKVKNLFWLIRFILFKLNILLLYNDISLIK